MSSQPNERWTSSWRMWAALVMPRMAPAWAIALAVSAPLLVAPAQATVFVVNSTVDSVDALPGDGVCTDASGACTLRAAVMETNALAGPDIVRLPAGTYVLAIPGTDEYLAATGDLDVRDDLRLLGAGADVTIIDANGLDRVLEVRAAATLKGLTITGGHVAKEPTFPVWFPARGGGILWWSHLVLEDSIIAGNSADAGGGIAADYVGVLPDSTGPKLWARSVAVVDNTARFGGGISFGCAFGDPPYGLCPFESTIESSTIAANSAEWGDGAIYLRGGKLTLRSSSVSNNSTITWWGPGIENRGGSLTLVNSSISGNSGYGVLTGPACVGGRGQISCHDGDTRIQNSTIARNLRGVVISDDEWGSGSVTVVASIVANNGLGPDCTGSVTSLGHSLDSDGTCNLTAPTDLPNTDPMLGPLQDNGGLTWTHALLPGSPAIDAIRVADCAYDDDGDPGTPEVSLTQDQRGLPRPQGDACDIGSYEVTACADGIDNDGDAFVDATDPGCRDATSVREDPQCQDGINNDPGQDDLTDFDGGLSVLGYVAAEPDPQCVGTPWKNNEFRQPSCGFGSELALLLPPLMWMWRRRSLQ